MSHPSSVAVSSTAEAIPSAQLGVDGHTPRFGIVPWGTGHDWDVLARTEAATGVEPSVRLFLEMQLEPGDLVVDLSPDAGFVALSSATHAAAPHVICVVADVAHAEALTAAANASEVFIESVLLDEITAEGLMQLVQARLLAQSRVFVHAAAQSTTEWLTPLAPLADEGRLVAWCQGGAAAPESIALAHASLMAHGFTPHELAEHAGEAQLFVLDTAMAECLAIHDSVLTPEDTPPPTHPTPPSGAVGRDGSTAVSATSTAVHAPPPLTAHASSGFHFIAPFCRTGYGIVGAQLLRALHLRDVPVSFFPLGAVDTNILAFDGLDAAMARQDDFDATLPSVRLSQQFDLAMHVGHGPRIGFPIFELSRFSERERHHLASQDRLLVCSEWARGVLLENGIWKSPIDVVPLGVDRELFHERLNVPSARNETVFLQVGKLEPRKGQVELLRAFEAAFTARDAVRLVYVCHNPFLSADAFTRALQPFRASPMAKRITLHTKPLGSQHEVAALMAAADCGVFVSRAEGWNLEALEMLSVGRTVIATNYSAHTEYLTDANARLVDCPALEQAPGSVRGASWAAWGAAQHEQLVEQLRAVHRERSGGPLPLNEAGLEAARTYSWDNAAVALLRAINPR